LLPPANTTNSFVGQHPGIEGFTIGQRRGIGVAMGEPYFVTKIDPSRRQVVIGPEAELGRSSLTADATNWLVDMPTGPFKCQAQIRYNSVAKPATATLLEGNRLSIALLLAKQWFATAAKIRIRYSAAAGLSRAPIHNHGQSN